MRRAIPPSSAAPPDIADPGSHRAALATLGATPAAIATALQGLLLHDAAARAGLYGAPPANLDLNARQTLPVAERLAQILAHDPRPLTTARAPFERAVATCRDFALLAAAALRDAGWEAEVRGGFADYLGGNGFEDHWLCACRPGGERRWRLVDAQLDAPQRTALGIDFPIADVPPDRFLTADRAWREVRAGRRDAAAFGHGQEATGLWFLFVNLVRDHLARGGRIASPWDGWRAAAPAQRHVAEGLAALGDRLAAGDAAAAVPDAPPWRMDLSRAR